jgi:single-stranded DNA-binding protein
MLVILISGKLLKDPVKRTSATGKPYATALLSVPTDDGQTLVSCVAFSNVAEQLLSHSQGDSLSVLGKAKLSEWTKDGEAKHGLDMVVDKLLSPYELTKRREGLSEPPRAKPTQPAAPEPAFQDDDVPF